MGGVQQRVHEQYLRSLYDDLAHGLELLERGDYRKAEATLRASYATRLTLDLYADAKAQDFRLLRAGPGADGRFEVSVRTELAQNFIGMLAGWFNDQGATNYIEVSAYSEELGPLVFTMQRLHGKTPHQLRQEAEAELAAMRAAQEV